MIAPFGDRGLPCATSDWLRSRPPSPRPFALVVSFDDPHSICEFARNQPMPYGPPAVAKSPRDNPPLPANHGPAAYEPEALHHERRRGAAMYGTVDYGVEDWRAYRYAYARLVERTDRHVAAVLQALSESGLAEHTIVVYTSDHGDGDASHAWNQKTALHEECARVPLIVRDPRRRTHPSTCSALVTVGLDLLPTMLAAGRQDQADDPDHQAELEGLPGQDLLALLDGGAGHEQVVVQTCFAPPQGDHTTGRALITDRYKYVVYSWGANREQLFDLKADPGEMRNLAAESPYDSVLHDLRARLLAWCLDTQDLTFLKRLVLPPGIASDVHDRIFEFPY